MWGNCECTSGKKVVGWIPMMDDDDDDDDSPSLTRYLVLRG